MAPWRERKCYPSRVAALSLIKLISIGANRTATCESSRRDWNLRKPGLELGLGLLRRLIAVALRLNAPPVIDVGAEVLSPMSCITRWASLTRIGTENALACAIIDGTVAVAHQAQDFE